MKVQSLVGTFNNPTGLNATLWHIYNQVQRPDEILIVNSGRALDDRTLIYTMHFINARISIKIKRIKNYPDHLGCLRREQFQRADDDVLVWFLDDDLYIPRECLRNQLMEETPNVPFSLSEYYDDVKEDEKTSGNCGWVGMKKFKVLAGAFYGLLVASLQLKSVDFQDWHYFDDNIVLNQIQPWSVPNTWVCHIRPFNQHPYFYTAIHKLWREKANDRT